MRVGNNKKGHILLKYNSYEIFVITIQNIKQNGKNKPQNTINTTQNTKQNAHKKKNPHNNTTQNTTPENTKHTKSTK